MPARAMSRRSARGLTHGREIGVFHQRDFAVAGMMLEVLFDRLLRFANVDGEKNEPFWSEFLADLVDEGSFFGAVTAPGGPELEKSLFTLDGCVVELLAGRGRGVKAGSRHLFIGSCGEAESAAKQCGGRCAAGDEGSHAHGGKIAQNRDKGLGHGNPGIGTETALGISLVFRKFLEAAVGDDDHSER